MSIDCQRPIRGWFVCLLDVMLLRILPVSVNPIFLHLLLVSLLFLTLRSLYSYFFCQRLEWVTCGQTLSICTYSDTACSFLLSCVTMSSQNCAAVAGSSTNSFFAVDFANFGKSDHSSSCMRPVSCLIRLFCLVFHSINLRCLSCGMPY